MLAERDDFMAALEALKRGRAARIEAERRRIVRDAFLARNPGLEEALKIDHHITRDLDVKLTQWGSLTEKQIALAIKLHGEATRPKPVAAELPKGEHKGAVGKREVFDLSLVRVVAFDRAGYGYGRDVETGYILYLRRGGRVNRGVVRVEPALPQAGGA